MTIILKGYKNQLGREFELKALEMIDDSIDNNAITFNDYFDIEWNGIKIDVKAREPVYNSWKFGTRKPRADYYLCFGLINRVIKKIFFVPRNIFNKGFASPVINVRNIPFTKYRFYEVYTDEFGKLNKSLTEILNKKIIIIPPDKKYCSICATIKPIVDFPKYKGGIRPYCHPCYNLHERLRNPGRKEYNHNYWHTVQKFKNK